MTHLKPAVGSLFGFIAVLGGGVNALPVRALPCPTRTFSSHPRHSCTLADPVADLVTSVRAQTPTPTERGPLFAPINPVVPDPPNVVENPNWLIATSGFCSNLNVVMNNERDVANDDVPGNIVEHFVADISFNYYPQTSVKFTDFPHHKANTIEGDQDEADALVSPAWDHRNIALLEPTSTCSADEQNEQSWGISVFKVEEHRPCTDDETAWEGHPCVHFSGSSRRRRPTLSMPIRHDSCASFLSTQPSSGAPSRATEAARIRWVASSARRSCQRMTAGAGTMTTTPSRTPPSTPAPAPTPIRAPNRAPNRSRCAGKQRAIRPLSL